MQDGYLGEMFANNYVTVRLLKNCDRDITGDEGEEVSNQTELALW